MRYFVELTKRQLQQSMAYRANWLFAFLSGFFLILIQISIWKALYAGKGDVAGINLPEMITYVLVVRIVDAFTRAGFIYAIERDVRYGDIGMKLIRPVSYKSAKFAENIGKSIGEILTGLTPILILSIFLFGMKSPASTAHGIGFVFMTLGAVVLNYYIQFTLGTTVFWVISAAHPNSLNTIFSTIFAGRIVPLWFFPAYINTIAQWLPYQFLYFLPAAVYLGKVPVEDLPSLCLLQLAWIAGMVLIERFVWSKAIRKTVVQGG